MKSTFSRDLSCTYARIFLLTHENNLLNESRVVANPKSAVDYEGFLDTLRDMGSIIELQH